MNQQILLLGLAQYFCFLLIVTVHEFGHALAAVRLGDDTPRLQGRVTLNPLAHIDPLGTVALPLLAVVLSAMGSGLAGFIIGWGRPVQFNPNNFHNRNGGSVLVAMAGPFMNVLIAIAAVLLLHAGGMPHGDQLISTCLMLANLSMLLFFFNLLPIPPLDGSYLLKQLSGMSWETFHSLGRYGFFVLILAMQWPPVSRYLFTATQVSVNLIARAAGIDAGRF